VLPIRNEADHIEACLERLLRQDYPRDRLEVLVVDGASDDGTPEVVERVRANHPDADLRLLDNPQRTVPPALNIGIRAARGDVIVRMDGHAVPAPDYVAACVAALARSGAANVGGVVEAEGATPFGQAVALATQHPLGAGDAKHRIGGAAGDVDTVPFGAFRRDVFDKVGLFDESLVRNQDYEFNVRIRAAGERVHFDPRIRFAYTPRGSARALVAVPAVRLVEGRDRASPPGLAAVAPGGAAGLRPRSAARRPRRALVGPRRGGARRGGGGVPRHDRRGRPAGGAAAGDAGDGAAGVRRHPLRLLDRLPAERRFARHLSVPCAATAGAARRRARRRDGGSLALTGRRPCRRAIPVRDDAPAPCSAVAQPVGAPSPGGTLMYGCTGNADGAA
jgi:hypothetical protein